MTAPLTAGPDRAAATVPPVPQAPPGGPRPGAVARVAVRTVRLYQHVFSGRPSPCRFWPSCSEYAIEAFTSRGLWRGGWLTTRRVARCHPWGSHGVDPVPERAAPGVRATQAGPGVRATQAGPGVRATQAGR